MADATRRWQAWRLADDLEVYGPDAGRYIVTTEDGEDEISGFDPMDEERARQIVKEHNDSLPKEGE